MTQLQQQQAMPEYFVFWQRKTEDYLQRAMVVAPNAKLAVAWFKKRWPQRKVDSHAIKNYSHFLWSREKSDVKEYYNPGVAAFERLKKKTLELQFGAGI